MKIITNAQKLRDTLALVGRIGGNKPSMPVLGCILLEASKGRLHLTSTNLDLTVQASLPAEITDGASFCLNAAMLSRIAGEMPDDTITIHAQSSKTGTVFVESGRSRFRLHTISAEEFPPLRLINGEGIKFAQSDLASKLEAVAGAASTDETRYILNGVFINANKSGKFDLVATDGRRLHVLESKLEGIPTCSAIFPSAGVSKVLGLLKFPGNVTLLIDERRIQATLEREDGDVIFQSKVVEGAFPNWRQVIPARDSFLEVDRLSFSSAVSRVAMVTSDKMASVKFQFGEDEVVLSAASPDLGEAQENYAIANPKKLVGPLAVNPKFLLQGLDAVGDEKVQLSIDPKGSDAAPLLIKAGGLTAVIMPVRIQ